jgi:hypothetical protein
MPLLASGVTIAKKIASRRVMVFMDERQPCGDAS